MKQTEKYFKFPIRLYIRKEVEDLQQTQDSLPEGVGVGLPDPIMSFETCRVEDIAGWRPMFGAEQDREAIEKEGINHTIVTFYDREETICEWNSTVFEEKLDAHAAKLEELESKEKGLYKINIDKY